MHVKQTYKFEIIPLSIIDTKLRCFKKYKIPINKSFLFSKKSFIFVKK